jgi:hypothetical protein
MNVQNLSIGDFGTKANGLGPNWQTVSVPAVVSFDVVWSGPITRQVTVTNGTLGNQYAGDYFENQVTVTWSGTNLATGFSFTSDPGTLATSVVDGGFAELGHEQNGIFFDSSSSDTATSGKADALLTHALAASAALPASTGTAHVPPPIAAGPSATTVASGQAGQVPPGPLHPLAGAGHVPVIDQLFADLSGELWERLQET